MNLCYSRKSSDMKDRNENGRKAGRNEPEVLIWGWICWAWLWKEQPWITNWAHLSRHPRDTAHTNLTQPLFQVRAAFPRAQELQNTQGSPSCRQTQGDELRPAGSELPQNPLSFPKCHQCHDPAQHPAAFEYFIQHNELWLFRINLCRCSRLSVGEG